MAPTIPTLYHELCHLVPKLLDRVEIDVRIVGAGYSSRTHRADTSCKIRDDQAVKRRTLSAISNLPESCPTCLTVTALPKIAGSEGEFLLALHTLHKAVVRRGRVASRSDTATMKRRRSALERDITKVRDVRASINLTTDESTAVDKILKRVDAVFADLEGVLGEGSDELLDDIRMVLFGDNHVNVAVDDTPVLIGIHPYNKRDWQGNAAAVLERFRAGEDKVVLLVPNYVAFWLTRDAANNRYIRMPAVAAGMDESQVQTAIRLWEPDGDSGLSTLAGAVAAARLV